MERARLQILIPEWVKRALVESADEAGLRMGEFVRQILVRECGPNGRIKGMASNRETLWVVDADDKTHVYDMRKREEADELLKEVLAGEEKRRFPKELIDEESGISLHCMIAEYLDGAKE